MQQEIYLVEVEGAVSPRYFIEDYEEALDEAKRLSVKYNRRTFVFKAVKMVEVKYQTNIVELK